MVHAETVIRKPHAALALLLAGMLAHAATAQAAAAPSQPNFIVIYGEGSGWTSSSAQMDERNPASRGTTAVTPGLERLAKAGMTFSDGYAPSPRCTPSRAGLLTGRSPAALHMTFVANGSEDGPVATKLIPPKIVLELPASEATIPEVLKRAGYATAHFGKWHLGNANPSVHGFDENDGPNNNGGPDQTQTPNPKQSLATTALGIGFMERQAKAGKPFYLQISQYPNQGQRPPEQIKQDLVDADYSMVQILDAVNRLGLAGNTYVFYSTDHGTIGARNNAPLSGAKGLVWEGGIRVPFLFAGPGIKAGSYSHVRVTQLDLLPTIAALAKVREQLPASVEGGSFAPLLLNGGVGRVQRPREEFVVHVPHYDPQSPASAIFLGNYKLIRIYETGERRLYDLAKDISEQNDLSAQMPEKTAELDNRLTAYLTAVNAQMTTVNPNPAPQGAAGGMGAGMAGGMGAGMGGGMEAAPAP